MSCIVDWIVDIVDWALCIVDWPSCIADCAPCITSRASSFAGRTSRSDGPRDESAVQKSELLGSTRDHADPSVAPRIFVIEYRRLATRYRRLHIVYRDLPIERRRSVTMHRRPIIVDRDLGTRQSRSVAPTSDLCVVHCRSATSTRGWGGERTPTVVFVHRIIAPLCQFGGMRSLLADPSFRSRAPLLVFIHGPQIG